MADPEIVAVVQSNDAAHYTSVDQAEWFFDRLARAFGSFVNPRRDEDGGTIRWFENYTLPLGWWLIGGMTPLSDDALRTSLLRPLPDWPAR